MFKWVRQCIKKVGFSGGGFGVEVEFHPPTDARAENPAPNPSAQSALLEAPPPFVTANDPVKGNVLWINSTGIAGSGADLLREKGFILAGAKCAATALTALQESQFDCVVCSLLLSVQGDGPELMKWIKEQYCRIPLIAYVGRNKAKRTETDCRTDAISAGANDIAFDSNQLLYLVTQYCSGRAKT